MKLYVNYGGTRIFYLEILSETYEKSPFSEFKGLKIFSLSSSFNRTNTQKVPLRGIEGDFNSQNESIFIPIA